MRPVTAALVLLLLASISGGHTDGDNVEPEYDDDDEEVSEEDLPPPEQRLSVKVTYPRQESLVFSELMWVTLLVENHILTTVGFKTKMGKHTVRVTVTDADMRTGDAVLRFRCAGPRCQWLRCAQPATAA